MFNIEYLAMNVGSELVKGGDIFKYEELTSDGTGKITLSATAVPIMNATSTYAYVRLPGTGDNKFTKVPVQADNTLTGLTPSTTYCVRYMYTDASASKMTVSSNFIPSTVSIVLTANLYSGDACNPSTGTNVGTLTIKVPRFQLNGTQDLAMTASGASQTSFEGSALASGCQGCDDQGVYAEIVQAIIGEYWYTDANGIIIADSYIEATTTDYDKATPQVYAWYSNAAPKLINNTILAAQESNLTEAEKTKLVYAITPGTTGLNIDASTGAITGTAAAGTATITVTAQMSQGSTPIPGMDASATIVLTAGD